MRMMKRTPSPPPDLSSMFSPAPLQRPTLREIAFALIALAALALNLAWEAWWVGQQQQQQTSRKAVMGPVSEQEHEATAAAVACEQTGHDFHPVLSNWTVPTSVDQLVVGSGSRLGPDDRDAVCVFHRDQLSLHFPHAMQQLYACVSYWQSYPDHSPILEIVRSRSRGLLGMFRYSLYERRNSVNPFLPSFFDRISSALGVEIVETDHPSPKSVRALLGETWRDGFKMLPGHAAALRDAVLETREATPSESCPVRLRIGILNRQKNRSILNVRALLRAIASRYRERQEHPPPQITVVHFEGKSFDEQIDFFAQTDIIISPHGAQLTGLPFMPTCGAVLEVFPENYWIPTFFGSLAAVTGLSHTHVYLGNPRDTPVAVVAAMEEDKRLRSAARRVDLCPALSPVLDAVDLLWESWSLCCRRREQSDDFLRHIKEFR